MKIIYVLLLLVGASAAASGQSEFSKQTLAVNPPFTLTIAAYQSNFDEENTAELVVKDISIVSLRIRKTNISDHEILKMSHAGGSYGYDLDVRDSGGKVVGPKRPDQISLQGDDRGAVASGSKDMMLQPGESKVDFVPLFSWFDMAKLGTYTVQASAHTTDDPKSPVVKSNIIKVTVLPAE